MACHCYIVHGQTIVTVTEKFPFRFRQSKCNYNMDDEHTVHERMMNAWRTDTEWTQNKHLHVRMHDGCLRTHDEIVQSKICFSVHVAFTYCSIIVFHCICIPLLYHSIKALISSCSSSALDLVQHIQTSSVLQSFIVCVAYLWKALIKIQGKRL